MTIGNDISYKSLRIRCIVNPYLGKTSLLAWRGNSAQMHQYVHRLRSFDFYYSAQGRGRYSSELPFDEVVVADGSYSLEVPLGVQPHLA